MKRPLLFVVFIYLVSVSCQGRVQNNEQSPYLDRPAGDSLYRDTTSDDSATWEDTSATRDGNTTKTTDSLQSPSFP